MQPCGSGKAFQCRKGEGLFLSYGRSLSGWGAGRRNKEKGGSPAGEITCLFGQESLELLVELGHDFEEVVNDAVIGFGEDGCFRVFVDGDDNL